MAQGTNFEEADAILGRPEGMTQEQCDDLYVKRMIDKDEIPVVISCWKFSPEEIEEIINTKQVWLIMQGKTMPPAMVSGHKPFRHFNEIPPKINGYEGEGH